MNFKRQRERKLSLFCFPQKIFFRLMKKVALLLIIFLVINSAKAQDDGEFKVKTSSPVSDKKEKDKSDEESAYKAGSFGVLLGYGFPNLYKNLYKGFIVNATSISSYPTSSQFAYTAESLGPVFLKAEYALTKLIGLGINLGYLNVNISETEQYKWLVYNSATSTYEYQNYNDVIKYNYSSFTAAARINFHYSKGEKLDAYSGVAVGYNYNVLTSVSSSDNPNANIRDPFVYVGIPFHFSISTGLRYYFTPNIGIYAELGFDKWSLIQGGAALKF